MVRLPLSAAQPKLSIIKWSRVRVLQASRVDWAVGSECGNERQPGDRPDQQFLGAGEFTLEFGNFDERPRNLMREVLSKAPEATESMDAE
jgi:hypothetical protein